MEELISVAGFSEKLQFFLSSQGHGSSWSGLCLISCSVAPRQAQKALKKPKQAHQSWADIFWAGDGQAPPLLSSSVLGELTFPGAGDEIRKITITGFDCTEESHLHILEEFRH